MSETAAPTPPRTVAQSFGEIVWLMSQSPVHKHFSLADLEWMVMPAVLLEQYRLYFDGTRPAGVVLWARVDEATAADMLSPRVKLRPDQWRSGEIVWVIDIVTPGVPNQQALAGMLGDFKRTVFPDNNIWVRQLDAETGAMRAVELASQKPEMQPA